MLFNTISYLAFLAIAVAVFWLLPLPPRRWLILVASIVFYALWRVEFVFLIMFSAYVDYFFSLKIYHEERLAFRRLWLWCSLSINLGLLAYFKYTYFIVGNATVVAKFFGIDWTPSIGAIVLPLGISFYTFLSISYTLDVYRRLFVPIRAFGTYLSYVMFWPHMIAGPILRAHELIPQLVESSHFRTDELGRGLRRVLFGLFLKVALADQLAPLVDDAFLSDPTQLSALDVWTMGFAFGLQIYFDFAGYSMIAIGSAQLLGVRFPENFNWPYLSTSPREFWKRWHITLSSWIRDYLYLPLSGVRFRDESQGGLDVQFISRDSTRVTVALFVTWFLMGLWHGANWNFAVWGLWHAIAIYLYRILAPRVPVMPGWLSKSGGWLITLAVAMLGWIPFRAGSVEAAFRLWSRILDWRGYTYLSFRENFYLLVATIFLGMLALHFGSRMLRNSGQSLLYRIADIGLMASGAFIVFIYLRPVGQFIYFQF